MNAGPRSGRFPTKLLIAVIEIYRNMISPYRPPSCRFTPTCSQYAVDALSTHGLFRGTWLAVARLAKCGPWHRGGWDPIPEKTQEPDAGSTLRSDSFV
jgi:putative membrane protein insertion efficiency factor